MLEYSKCYGWEAQFKIDLAKPWGRRPAYWGGPHSEGHI